MATNKLNKAAEERRNKRANRNPAADIIAMAEPHEPDPEKKTDKRTKENYMYIDVGDLKEYLRYRSRATGMPMSKYIYELIRVDAKQHQEEYMADMTKKLESLKLEN